MTTPTQADPTTVSPAPEPSASTARYRAAERRWWDSVDITPTEERIHLPRLGVDLRLQAAGAGEPVVFVHGAPSAGAQWVPMVPGLSDRFRCLLVDRPGTGLSEPLPGDVSFDTFQTAFVVDVLDALNIDRAHLVASSLGGLLAIHAAATHPDRIGRTVQLGCPGGAPGSTVPLVMRLMAVPGVGRLLERLPPTERSTAWQLRTIGHGASLDAGRLSDELLDWALSYARDTDTMANDQALLAGVMSIRGVDPAVTIPQAVFDAVDSPTSFIWGEDDPFGGPTVARETAARMPDAELELVPDAGHLPWLDVPEYASATARDFLLE